MCFARKTTKEWTESTWKVSAARPLSGAASAETRDNTATRTGDLNDIATSLSGSDHGEREADTIFRRKRPRAFGVINTTSWLVLFRAAPKVPPAPPRQGGRAGVCEGRERAVADPSPAS